MFGLSLGLGLRMKNSSLAVLSEHMLVMLRAMANEKKLTVSTAKSALPSTITLHACKSARYSACHRLAS